jgi:hypothetical protein
VIFKSGNWGALENNVNLSTVPFVNHVASLPGSRIIE